LAQAVLPSAIAMSTNSSLSAEIAKKDQELRVLREKQELAVKKQQIITIQEKQEKRCEQHLKLARQTERILEQQAKQQKKSDLQKLRIHAPRAPLSKL